MAATGATIANARRSNSRRRSTTSRAQRDASRREQAGPRSNAKGGMPRIALGGLKDRSEGTSGENARLAERRQAQAIEAAAAARERIEILQPLSVVIPSRGLSANKTVLKVDAVTAGYEPDWPIIRDLSFAVTGPERLAVIGPNGCGKTTLLAIITGKLQPWSGTVRII